MKSIMIYNNSPGSVTVKIIKPYDSKTITKQLSNYNDTNESLEVELEVGDMITIENEGDEFD